MSHRFLACIVVLMLVLTGCSSGDTEPASTSSAEKPKEDKSVLRMACIPIDTLNPLITGQSTTEATMSLVYEGLFMTKPDLTVTPRLAESYECSEDNKTYTIKLKKGVKFHDGSSFDANDVTATLGYIAIYGGRYASKLSNIAMYEADGSHRLKVYLKNPAPDFVNDLDFPILSSDMADADFAAENENFIPNGTGMYKYDKKEKYKKIFLKVNDGWHGSDKKPGIEAVEIEILSDIETVEMAFDAGAIDVFTTGIKDWDEQNLVTKSYNTYETIRNDLTYLGINCNCAMFDTPEERQVVADSLDIEGLTADIMLGHGKAAYSPIVPGAYYNEPDKIPAPKKAASPKAPESDRNTGEDEDDKRPKATEASDEDNKNTVILLYNSDNKTKGRLAATVKHSLETHGFSVEFAACDYATYLNKVALGQYDLYIGEVSISNSGNVSFMFGSQSNGQNICNFHSMALDNHMNDINMAYDKDEKQIAWESFEEFYKEKNFQIPLYFTNSAVMINKRIGGEPNVNMSSLFNGFENLYIKNN